MNRRSLVAAAVILVASIVFGAWKVHEHRVHVALMNREDIPNPVKAEHIAKIHVSPMQPVPFRQDVLDNRRGNHKAKVIINPDGLGSVVAAIYEPSTVELYRAAHESFSIAHPGYIGGDEDAQVADIDGDGTPDIVTGGQNFIVSVLLNPGRSACSNVYRCPWASLTIDRGRNSHDVQIGDVNGNGRPDVVTEQGVYFNEDGGRHWDFAGREVIPRDGQGTTVGVLDADGFPDIIAPFHLGTMLARFVNPRHHRGDPLHERWQADVIDAHPLFTGNMSTAIADVDHDGRNDILLAPMYGGGGLVWYQAVNAWGTVAPAYDRSYHQLRSPRVVEGRRFRRRRLPRRCVRRAGSIAHAPSRRLLQCERRRFEMETAGSLDERRAQHQGRSARQGQITEHRQRALGLRRNRGPARRLAKCSIPDQKSGTCKVRREAVEHCAVRTAADAGALNRTHDVRRTRAAFA
ncbi:hypothetical protein WPS_02470 [Vulcanimicrobium alpinum]|uniref:VCBS repeat-containing protein n=1 Tax=Vulcanimicrobium alpinum TaxID=3016050 RepID=A0AAN1XV40_UNVUL|nr:VCBS repeat-containing protein [Vulcanimicrobium alpinum]BDE04971.1 hypothetical protein WPS_02470 [Vulcanimicrobium alpinum]